MTHRALVVSHADADGHLIAEQTRRNLALIPDFEVQTVVDPERTKDHKVWKRLEEIQEINNADFVFFVDLMFGPATFAEESKALVNFVRSYPTKKFFLIDHHPLPLRRLEDAGNLRAKYRPEVFECAIGPRSGMMVVAALCERQNSSVADIKEPLHDILAQGVRRAAAHGGPLPGEKLLTLMRFDCWDGLAQLGRDDPALHRLPRGRRPANQPQSETLKELDTTAMELLATSSNSTSNSTMQATGTANMTYDFEALQRANIGRERFPRESAQGARVKNSRPHPEDLEAIVTLLEVAALSLTTEADATFSLQDLIREAQELGGDEVAIEERDAKIVLEKANFVERVSGGFRLR